MASYQSEAESLTEWLECMLPSEGLWGSALVRGAARTVR